MTDSLIRTSPSASFSSEVGGPSRPVRFMPALAILFVGSGCAALIYEIVWLQMLQLVIGVSALSLGVLLGTFMGGMCLGSLLFPRIVSMSRHPLRVYAMLELAIGAIGLIELKLVPVVADLYTHIAVAGSASVMLRAALAGICLLPPTILMGATLPAIARWVEATPRGVSWLGFFYGTNILGAVTGCLLAGFYLLPKYDMATATMWAAVINASVAGLGLLLSLVAKHTVAPRETKRPSAMAAPGAWSIYVAIGLSGLTGLGAEVVWTRMLSLMLGATVYTFSLILAVFLLGLGVGSSVGAVISRVAPRPRVALAWCQFLLAVAIGWAAYAITYEIPFWPMDPRVSLPDQHWYMFQADLMRCFWALSPGALLWGASFPLALGALAEKGQDAGKLVGGVYAANTVGAIVGSLAFSMFMIPWYGTQGAQRILMVLCAVSGVVLLVPVVLGRVASRVGSAESESRGGAGSRLLASLGVVAGVVCAWLLALTVGPPNWVSVAWGRNSAEYMPTQYLPYPLSADDIGVMRDANSRGLYGLHLTNGQLTFKDASGKEPFVSDDNKAFVKLHEEALTSILKKKQELTGVASILGDDEKSTPDRYCTFVGEGMNVSVAVTYDNHYDDDAHKGLHPTGYRYFHGAGKVQASSNPDDMRLQRTLGHISALTTRTKDGPKDVLVVACGAGVTAGSFVPYGSNITIVDIEPMVPKFVTPQFADMNYHVIPTDVAFNNDPLGYKNTKVLIDDGRHFIRTTPRKFDVITSDPIDPWVKGCAALNTVEYYQMCREHLKPGGVMALWIPLYESSDDTAKSVIATFFKVFPNGIIWSNDQQGSGYDAVLYGAVPEEGQPEAPLKINIDEMQKYIDAHPAVKQSLRDVDYGTQAVPGTCEAVELLATYAGTAPRMKDWTKGTEDLINYDRDLRLQYVAGLSVNQYQQVAIFNGILQNYSFPTEIFSGTPERMEALKQVMANTGRVER